jgi:hypothetical protein
MMSARAESLAKRVEQANNSLLEAVEATNDGQWKAKVADGEWPQGFAGYHAAASIGSISGMVQALASGQPFTPISMDQIEAGNAATFKEHADCKKDEVLGMIRANSPASVQMVRGLSDEELDRKVSLLIGGPEMTVEQVAEMLLVGHTMGHTESIVKAR